LHGAGVPVVGHDWWTMFGSGSGSGWTYRGAKTHLAWNCRGSGGTSSTMKHLPHLLLFRNSQVSYVPSQGQLGGLC
jgi:hypothetical protein